MALLCFGIDAVALYNFSTMNGVYAGDIPAEISNRYQAAAVIGIFAFYNAVLFVLDFVRCRGKWKNRGLNSVFLGSLFRKVSSTAKVLSMSTLAITVSLVAFVIMPMRAEITTGYLEYRMPYHIMIYNTYRYIDEMEDIPQIDFSFVGKSHMVSVTLYGMRLRMLSGMNIPICLTSMKQNMSRTAIMSVLLTRSGSGRRRTMMLS